MHYVRLQLNKLLKYEILKLVVFFREHSCHGCKDLIIQQYSTVSKTIFNLFDCVISNLRGTLL